jgi:1,4-alpha-glucan branching enzyme
MPESMDQSGKKEMGAVLHGTTCTFRVWAPFAKGVAVSGSFNDWTSTPMVSENGGNWATEVQNAQAGQEYRYLIDSGSQQLFKNDPRALQVNTSAGNSIIVDTNFDWAADDFKAPNFNEQVIYELHVGTFNREDPSTQGTFKAATEKLDYLAELGVNMVELMPITSMSLVREWWGYTPDYLYAVESQYGGRHQFLEFVKAAHRRGIGVILDVVYNHLGPDKNLDLWQFDGWNQDGHGGIYFYNDWRAETPWGATRPDYGRLEVRQYIADNVRMWMRDCHLDGLRVDSTIFIRNVKGRNNDPGNDLGDGWGLLQEITDISKEINPRSITIAEDVSGNEYITKKVEEGGAGFSSQWEVGFPHVLRDALDVVDDANRNLTAICDSLSRKYNNDVFERVIYSDSHDTAANGGARLSEEIAPGDASNVFARKRSLLASAIILTAPGIPMLFAGQEFMEGGSFNDWQALDWKKIEKFRGIVQAHSHLIALRKNQYGNTRGLISQSFNILHLNEGDKVLAYHRWDQGGPKDDVVIVINFANKEQKDYWINFPNDGIWKARFNSNWRGYSSDFEEIGVSEVVVSDSSGKINIGPYSVIILSQDQ